MKAHSCAQIFPLIEGVALEELAEDIRTRGQLDPILLFNGEILDGRNRWNACGIAGVTPITEEYEGTDPLGEVISRNLRRRHLSESQRAMVAARIATLANHRPAKPANWPASAPSVPTQAQAAGLLNTSERETRRARVVLEHGTPELVHAVDSGRVAVSAAETIARLPRGDQPAAVASKMAHVGQATGENEWYTPSHILDRVRRMWGAIDLDPASSDIANKRVGAEQIYSKEDDGLTRHWSGRVWMNPPYASGLIDKFCTKMCAEVEAGRVDEAIVLVNNATETAWFSALASIASAVCFPKGRIRFLDPHGNPGAPLQGQAILYIGDDSRGFCSAFEGEGSLWIGGGE
jgi:phage N-6-adenine-methyltransferase